MLRYLTCCPRVENVCWPRAMCNPIKHWDPVVACHAAIGERQLECRWAQPNRDSRREQWDRQLLPTLYSTRDLIPEVSTWRLKVTQKTFRGLRCWSLALDADSKPGTQQYETCMVKQQVGPTRNNILHAPCIHNTKQTTSLPLGYTTFYSR